MTERETGRWPDSSQIIAEFDIIFFFMLCKEFIVLYYG